jgi:hypothetical protein
MVLRICGSNQNFYLFSVYRSPNADDTLFDCLLMTMARIQESDRRSAFVFVGDVNAHHVEWLSSRTPTNSSGRAALDFCSLSGCSQLIDSPTHEAGNCLDLVMTDVPDVVNASVGTPLGTSDHCYLRLAVEVSQALPFHDVSRVVYVKSRINWDRVRAEVSALPWGQIYCAADPVSSLNDGISGVIRRCVPTAVMRFRSGDTPWFTAECRRAFDLKQTAYRNWTRMGTHELWLEYQRVRAQTLQVYEAAKSAYFSRARDKLDASSSPHGWWETLKGSLFGSSSSLPALLGPGGRLVSSPADKAELLSHHFDSKQSRVPIRVPASCFPMPVCRSVAFRSTMVMQFLEELDSYGGVDPVGAFPLFYKKVADILAPRLSRIYRSLLRVGSFPECWRVANITAIPKGGCSADVRDYRPISITPILSKVYEKLLSHKLASYCESRGLFPARQFSYRKGLGCVDALLSVSHVMQSSLDTGAECRLVQLDFSAAFDRVSHTGLLYRLQCLGVGDRFLGVCREFLSGRKQKVVVDGSSSGAVDVVSGVPQGSVLGPLLFILYTAEMFDIVENHLVGYADDSTLLAVVRRPADRALVEASLLRDLRAIQCWCSDWGMMLNPKKTKSLVVSRSRTSMPPHSPLVFDGVVVEEVSVLKILGVLFDAKLTFEEHIRRLVSECSRKIGMLRMARRMFDDVNIVRRCFFAFILPVLEYCSPVWGSSAASHLSLLDRLVRSVSELCEVDDLVSLVHRRSVAGLCMFFKIYFNYAHPLHDSVFVPAQRSRVTRTGVLAHTYEVVTMRCRTVQFGRCFVPSFARLWNGLPGTVFVGGSMNGFKGATNRWLLES